MADTRDVLRTRFGLSSFLPGQEEVIEHLLAGHSAAAVFPTGGGKSLCYQLPALMLPGLTLVVSPLIALMKDQIDRLKARGIAAERMDSTLSADESRAVFGALQSGQLRLLYVAPERFNNERFREVIERARVSLFAVDEAHCISEWGHNFRPDYLKLAAFAKRCQAERILALTATVTPQVLSDVCAGFDIGPEYAVRTPIYRPNLTVLMTPIAEAERDAALVERLQTRPVGPTIVYVTLQRTAAEVAGRLAAAGYPARPYHAGMEDSDRAVTQDWFIESDRAVVVATIAFGMGIDKSNIRYVYHYNLPKSLENFSQEIGRSGRDGLPSACEMFVCPDDLNTLENFVYGDTPSLDSIQTFANEIFGLGNEFDLGLVELSNRHDIRPLVVRTLLAYLELDGYIEEGTPFYSSYQFRALTPLGEILTKFEGERRDFLAGLFRQSELARTWFHINLDEAAHVMKQPRDRLVRALDYLAQQGWLELKAEGVRNRFRRLARQPQLDELAQTLHTRTLAREAREIARLHQVPALAAHDGCQVSRLGEHFGEPLLAPCGHCSWCLNGQRAASLPPRPSVAIDEAFLQAAARLRAEHPDLLNDRRALARLLCGLGSPRLSRARLTSHPLFGALSQIPFANVLARTESI